MIKFFTNRELSQKLGINLARLKRWSREFLPPDPLGGLQSGYARQYNPASAFTIFLGGHLVAGLKFTIPEAKQILESLNGWLTNKGFYFNLMDPSTPPQAIDSLVKTYQIYILEAIDPNVKEFNFYYIIRGLISNKPAKHQNHPVREARYVETIIPAAPNVPPLSAWERARMLNLSELQIQFLTRLDLSKNNATT